MGVRPDALPILSFSGRRRERDRLAAAVRSPSAQVLVEPGQRQDRGLRVLVALLRGRRPVVAGHQVAGRVLASCASTQMMRLVSRCEFAAS